jgi:hypothetical protein
MSLFAPISPDNKIENKFQAPDVDPKKISYYIGLGAVSLFIFSHTFPSYNKPIAVMSRRKELSASFFLVAQFVHIFRTLTARRERRLGIHRLRKACHFQWRGICCAMADR